MPATYTDARDGLTTSVALKAPCKAMAATNITLAGEQTIDSVSCVAGDRVLVKGQTNGVENGIYVVSTSAWSRALDFDGALDCVSGTRVFINAGTAFAGMEAQLATSDPIIIGETAISFTVLTIIDSGIADDLATLAPLSAAISTVADNAANVATVALNDANVTAVGASIDDVNTLAAIADQFGDLESIATAAATSASESAASAAVSVSARDASIAASVSALQKAGGTMTGALTMSSAAVNMAKGSDVASASTIAIGAATGNLIDITGSVTITGADTVQAGVVRRLRFNNASPPLLTHSATFQLPGQVNFQPSQYDTIEMTSFGSGVWVCTGVDKYNGTPIALPAATTSVAGVSELATTAEMTTGTSTSLVPPVSAVKGAKMTCKAWAQFTGLGSAVLTDGYNVASVTYSSTGKYVVNFTNAMANANYSVTVGVYRSGGSNIVAVLNAAPGTGSFAINTMNLSNVATDADVVMVQVFGT